MQKAICGWDGTQVQALLGAVRHSNNRMPEARDSKVAMMGLEGWRGGVRGPPAQPIWGSGQASHPILPSPQQHGQALVCHTWARRVGSLGILRGWVFESPEDFRGIGKISELWSLSDLGDRISGRDYGVVVVEFEDLGGLGKLESGGVGGEEFAVWETIGIWEFGVVHIGR